MTIKKVIGNRKVFVGMSGGVDSSVAALLLKERGYDVTGCFIKGWYPENFVCSWQEDRRDAMRVAGKIGIPFLTVDLEKEYKRRVVDYMLQSFKIGETPNPDIMCNKHVKFGAFLKFAKSHGADFIATGHYVKKRECRMLNVVRGRNKSGLYTSHHTLHTAFDTNKDQSYFLWTLNQEQLKRCLFPLGNLTKPEVRNIARKNGLSTAEKKDSQGVCFIGKFNITDFLKKYIPVKKGKIITTGGEEIGEHDGVMFYTIGQRHGVSKGGGGPYYIVQKDAKKNILVVASKADEKKYYGREAGIRDFNWVRDEPRIGKLYKARIRYRQPLQTCRIQCVECSVWNVARQKESLVVNHTPHSTLHIFFTKPQRAITPGQSLVLYSGRTIVGGGVIDR